MKQFYMLLVLALTVMVGLNCGNDPTSSNGSGTGILEVRLTDAPGDFEEVNITFSEIAVHFGEDDSEESAAKTAGEWIIIGGEQTLDLLTLNDGITALIGNEELTDGHYTQLRLIISEANVLVDEGDDVYTTYDLDIPSGTVKFVSGFDIVDGETTTILIDFDAQRSVHQTGYGQYKLQPVIRMIAEDESGSVTGTILDFQGEATARVLIDDEIVAESPVAEDGHFTLSALLPGTYRVVIVVSEEIKFEQADVSVVAGQETDLGDITLN